MLRSKYAEAESEIYVECAFVYHDKKHLVKRSSEYERAKKRGDSMIRQGAMVELFLPDGRVITKLRNVNTEYRGNLVHPARAVCADRHDRSRRVFEIAAGLRDWHNRYSRLGLSDTIDAVLVIVALPEAMEKNGIPTIINSDQGDQFTNEAYIIMLQKNQVRRVWMTERV